MKPDVVYSVGKRNMPACIFIHGLGMDKGTWVEPMKARIIGGLFPLWRIIRKEIVSPDALRTLYHDLKERGYTVLTWSQSRPSGAIYTAVSELMDMIKFTQTLKVKGIILIGHSRGGLIAKSPWNSNQKEAVTITNIKAAITLGTPHSGTNMARWAVHLSPISHLLRPLIHARHRGKLSEALTKLLDFLESPAVRELLPDSDLLKALKDIKPNGVYCLSIGGTNPTLISIDGVFSIPHSLEKLLHGKLPEEMIDGKGDGLVSLKSSVFGDEHLSFPINHAELLFDREVRQTLIKKIEAIT